MQKSKQFFMIGLWGALVVLMVAIVASGVWTVGTGPGGEEVHKGTTANAGDFTPAGRVLGEATQDVLFDVPAFSLSDQNEKRVSKADLIGHVWVGAFMFTECPGVCPMMSKQMKRMQESVAGSDVKIVSFSLDPDHDTPAIRREYLKKIDGDEKKWLYLAGQKQEMYDLAKQMKIAAMPANGTVPIIHGEQVALVGRDGKIRNYYTGTDADSMKQLATDAAALAAVK